MSLETTKEKALEALDERLQDLAQIMKRATQDFDYEVAEERLKRWKVRAVKLISERVHPLEGEKLLRKHKDSAASKRPQDHVEATTKMYRGFILTLRENLIKHPEDILSPDIIALTKAKPQKEPAFSPATSSQPEFSRKVFIVYGEDELNALRLEKKLRAGGCLDVALMDTRCDGVSFIEKLENNARSASYTLFVLEPEDFIYGKDKAAPRARANLLFGLGWFCGRFGPLSICLLFNSAVKTPPDLDGLERIVFDNTVLDKIPEIEDKLKIVGLL